MINKLLCLCLLCYGCSTSNGAAQHQLNSGAFHKDSVVGVYKHIFADSISAVTIELLRDSTFNYFTASDLMVLSSSGTWRTNKDTLILNSFLKKSDIPIIIKSQKNSTDPKRIISIVRNNKGAILKEAKIFFNRDTVRYCMPAFEGDCDNLLSGAKEIRVAFNNSYSKWYAINETSFTKLEIIVNTNHSLDTYLFVEGSKFKFDSIGLYQITPNSIHFYKIKK